MLLTARQVQLAKPASRDYTMKDGRGLFLFVPTDGPKCWHFRYSFAGKQRRISFGTYPALSLQDARELTSTARTQLAHGTDPGHHRRTARKLSKETEEKLFRSAAERWYKRKEVAGRASSTLDKMRTYLDKDILPEIGSMMLQDITRADCARVQVSTPVEN
ncbi:integrase arm-type DNA-binding domain-containing protein [Burkholderia multivorans]|uniref:integrase arm-type DNA-binding domain-containing protein n=1 Tax=Burkholderia multivorans TaxID=87883 RepID=UPI0006820CED|nr:integrase arm-type DNA-binding domain-containing protein [Burkholderia multivorans]